MAWTVSTDGTLTHTGTTPEVFLWSSEIVGNGDAIEINCLSVSHCVGLVFFTNDGRDGWMAGVFDDAGASGSNLSLRRIDGGTIAAPVTGGDAPNDATPVAHGLSNNVPYTLRVELIDNRIIVSMRGALVSGTVQLAYLNDTAPTFSSNTKIGVWSLKNNARVTLVRKQPAEYRTSDEQQIAFWGVARDVWASYDGVRAELIARNVLPDGELVPTASYNGLGFFFGQGTILVFDPQARTVVPYSPTAGVLPGTRGGGSFDVIGGVVIGPRVGFAMRAGLIMSAINDPYDVDTGSLVSGGAFDTSAGIGEAFGQDLVSLLAATDDTLMIGTTNSIRSIVGDPALAARGVPITFDSGPSSWYAMATIDVSGLTFAHTPDGCVVFSTAGFGTNISGNVLREGLNIDRGERGTRIVTTVRDTQRKYMLVFQTNTPSRDEVTELGEPGLHFIYDESSGGYQAGAPAWFPFSFASSKLDVMRAVAWRGNVLMGCMDGQLRVFDDALAVDELSTSQTLPVTAYMEAMTIDAPGVIQGMMLNWVTLELSPGSSSVSIDVYGANTVSELFTNDGRFRLWTGTFKERPVNGYSPRETMMVRQRANAMAVRISGFTGQGEQPQRWFVEQVEGSIDLCPAVYRVLRDTTGVRALQGTCRPVRSLPPPAEPTPATPFESCGEDVVGPPDPTPEGVITVVMGALTATGQFVTPTVTVTGATGPFTYNWSVDGDTGPWASGDNSATAPAAELLAGTRTVRVTITGGTLREPLVVLRVVVVGSEVVGDPTSASGAGFEGTDGTVGTPGREDFGGVPIGEAMPAMPVCEISTLDIPAPPAGYGGGVYSGGGFL